MLLQVGLFSISLQVNTNVNIILPSPDAEKILPLDPKENKYFAKGKKYQVLYLLHGGYGDYSDWVRFTAIEKFAQKYQVAVVMPSVGNSFYHNMVHGLAYATYMTQELPQYITTYFNISDKREDTFIAGLSMGGYGALYLAMLKPELYAATASLSGAVDIAGCYDMMQEKSESPLVWNDIFADPAHLAGSDADIFALAEKNLKAGKTLPRIFQTVGTEDFTYEINQNGRKRFEAMPLDYTYTEHPGVHDWIFWNTYIQEAMEWMKLAGETVEG